MPIRKMAEIKEKKEGELFHLPCGPKPSDRSIPVSLSYLEIPPGGSVKAHTHDRFEMYIVMTGRAKMMAGGDICEVGPGNVLIAPIGTVHAIKVIGDRPLGYYALNSPPVATAPMVLSPAEVQKKFDEARG